VAKGAAGTPAAPFASFGCVSYPVPKELEVGMVLIDKSIGNEYEIIEGPKLPPKGYGDEPYFRIICHREGRKSEFTLSQKELQKKGMKFVRSGS
jgi:hypothetical protein